MLTNGHLHCLFLTSLHPVVFHLKHEDMLMSWKALLQREGVYWPLTQVGESDGDKSCSINIFECQSITKLCLCGTAWAAEHT